MSEGLGLADNDVWDKIIAVLCVSDIHAVCTPFIGSLRKAYLEMHRPILFNELVLSDKLFEHCAEIDEAARNRMELIVRITMFGIR